MLPGSAGFSPGFCVGFSYQVPWVLPRVLGVPSYQVLLVPSAHIVSNLISSGIPDPGNRVLAMCIVLMIHEHNSGLSLTPWLRGNERHP